MVRHWFRKPVTSVRFTHLALCEGRYGWLRQSVKLRWMKEAMKVRILLTQLGLLAERLIALVC